jgi:hypothetical protein
MDRSFLNWRPISSLTLGQLHRRGSSRQAAMMTMTAIWTSAATMEILARPSRAVRAQASTADGDPSKVALSSKSNQWQGAGEERWLGSGFYL